MSEKGREVRSRSRIPQMGILIVSAIILSGSIGYMIGADGPSGFGTVIEPGSMVETAQYIIFLDGSTYYAKNGTTGGLAYSDSSLDAIISDIMDERPTGATISLPEGDHTLSNDLILERQGVALTGVLAPMRQFDTNFTQSTNLIGTVYINASNIKLQNVKITGTLTFGSKADLSAAAHYSTLIDCAVYGQVTIEGRSGAEDAEVPFNIVWVAGEIRASTSTYILVFDNEGAPINHIWFFGTTFEQQGSGPMMSVKGKFTDVVFTSCLFLQNLNYPLLTFSDTGAVTPVQMAFIGGLVESGSNATVVSVPSAWSGAEFDILFDGVRFSAPTIRLLVDDTTSGYVKHRVAYLGCNFVATTVGVDSGFSVSYQPGVALIVTDCRFPENVVMKQYGPAKMIGEFRNNMNLNPYGIVTTPFGDPSSAYITIGWLGINADPWTEKNYTFTDSDVWITSTGGADVNITLYDGPVWGSRNIITTGLTNCTMLYVPMNYSISFGAFSSAPDVVVTFA